MCAVFFSLSLGFTSVCSFNFTEKLTLFEKLLQLSELTVLSLFTSKKPENKDTAYSTWTRIEKYVKLVAHTKELFIHHMNV